MKVPKPKRIQDRTLLREYHDIPCCICGHLPSDPSHIKTRGSGGPDAIFNITPMCREHHTEWGTIGLSKFLFKYPDFEIILIELGWETEPNLWHHLLLN